MLLTKRSQSKRHQVKRAQKMASDDMDSEKNAIRLKGFRKTTSDDTVSEKSEKLPASQIIFQVISVREWQNMAVSKFRGCFLQKPHLKTDYVRVKWWKLSSVIQMWPTNASYFPQFWMMGRAYASSSLYQDSLQIKVEGIFGEKWWMVKRSGPEINF